MNYFLKFSIDNVDFAVAIDEISEIARPKELVKKGQMSKYLAGHFLLRNKKVPTFDLPEFLGMKNLENFEVIVVRIKDVSFGIKVNRVFGIITTGRLMPYPEMARPEKYLHGLITEGNSVVQVFSLSNLLAGQRLRALKKYL